MPIEADKKPPESKNIVERVTDFSGGLNTTISGTLLNNNEAQVAYDVSYEQRGTLKTRRGSYPRYLGVSYPFGSGFKKVSGLGVHVAPGGVPTLLISTGDTIFKDSDSATKTWDTLAEWTETGSARYLHTRTDEEEGKLKNAVQNFRDRIYTDVVADWKTFNTATPLVASVVTPGDPMLKGRVAESALTLECPLASPDVPCYAGVSLADLQIDPADNLYYHVIAFIKSTDYDASMGDCKMSLCLLSDFDTTSPLEVSGTEGNSKIATDVPTLDSHPLKMLVSASVLAGLDPEKHGFAIKLYDSTGTRTAAMKMMFSNVYAYKISSSSYTGLLSIATTHGWDAQGYRKATEFNIIKSVGAPYGYTQRGYWVSARIDTSTLNLSNYVIHLDSVNSLSTNGHVNVYTYTSALTTAPPSSMVGWVSVPYTGYLGAVLNPTQKYLWIIIEVLNDASVSSATIRYNISPSLTSLYTKLSSNTETTFATLNGVTVIANGVDVPLKWDGVSATATVMTGVKRLSCVVVHNNRMWGIDTDNSSSVVFSNILDATTWDEYDVLNFNPNDGDRVVAIIPYGQVLVVAKEHSMAMVTGDSALNYNIVWLDSETGVTGLRGMCVADKYLVYVSRDGVRFTDLSNSTIVTEKLQATWDTIDKTMLSQTAIVYWRNKIYVSVSYSIKGQNDIILVYDILRRAWAIYRWSGINSFFVYTKDGTDYLIGGQSYTVTHLDITDVYTLNGPPPTQTVPITLVWQTKAFHFGYPERYKLFRNVFIDVEGIAAESSVIVEMYVDGVLTGTFTSTVAAGAGKKYIKRILPPLYGAVLGVTISFKIGTSCSIQSISIDYALRGNAPGGDV